MSAGKSSNDLAYSLNVLLISYNDNVSKPRSQSLLDLVLQQRLPQEFEQELIPGDGKHPFPNAAAQENNLQRLPLFLEDYLDATKGFSQGNTLTLPHLLSARFYVLSKSLYILTYLTGMTAKGSHLDMKGLTYIDVGV